MSLIRAAGLRSALLPLHRLGHCWLGATAIILLTYSNITAATPLPPRLFLPSALTDTVFWRLRGRVIDAYTAEPLPYAALWLRHLTLGAQSDEQGYFTFELSAEQLAAFPTDTLQVTAPAFLPHTRALAFEQQPTDSLLRITLARDSAFAQHAPVLTQSRQRGRRPTPAAAPNAQSVPRRSFWQRLFGGR